MCSEKEKTVRNMVRKDLASSFPAYREKPCHFSFDPSIKTFLPKKYGLRADSQ